jgi:hypothetical protein
VEIEAQVIAGVLVVISVPQIVVDRGLVETKEAFAEATPVEEVKDQTKTEVVTVEATLAETVEALVETAEATSVEIEVVFVVETVEATSVEIVVVFVVERDLDPDVPVCTLNSRLVAISNPNETNVVQATDQLEVSNQDEATQDEASTQEEATQDEASALVEEDEVEVQDSAVVVLAVAETGAVLALVAAETATEATVSDYPLRNCSRH